MYEPTVTHELDITGLNFTKNKSSLLIYISPCYHMAESQCESVFQSGKKDQAAYGVRGFTFVFPHSFWTHYSCLFCLLRDFPRLLLSVNNEWISKQQVSHSLFLPLSLSQCFWASYYYQIVSIPLPLPCFSSSSHLTSSSLVCWRVSACPSEPWAWEDSVFAAWRHVVLILPVCLCWGYSVKASVHWTSGASEFWNVGNEPTFV